MPRGYFDHEHSRKKKFTSFHHKQKGWIAILKVCKKNFSVIAEYGENVTSFRTWMTL